MLEDSDHFKYKLLLIRNENHEDQKLENLQKEFKESSIILLRVFPDLQEYKEKLII